jgi:hypothetical protein
MKPSGNADVPVAILRCRAFRQHAPGSCWLWYNERHQVVACPQEIDMPRRNTDAFRILRVKKGDDLKTIYAKARKAFTAADLQRYTVIEKGSRQRS